MMPVSIFFPTSFALLPLYRVPDFFVEGKVNLMGFRTGFWALDPAGDMKMLLTPNLHKTLYFVQQDKKLQKLMAMGILPGVSIQVVQKFPSFILKIGHSQIAMDEEMAKDIFIKNLRGSSQNITQKLTRPFIP